MPKIYLADSFKKDVKSRRELLKKIIREIEKFFRGSNNLVDLYSPAEDLKVLKAYLDSGKIRVAILLRVSKDIYIPFCIVKKESKIGWNLSKHSENILINKIIKVQRDIENKEYEEINIHPF